MMKKKGFGFQGARAQTSSILEWGIVFIIIGVFLAFGSIILSGLHTAPTALSALPSGGTPPYSYQWSTGSSCASALPGQTGQTLNVGTNTIYSVQITDSAANIICLSYSIS